MKRLRNEMRIASNVLEVTMVFAVSVQKPTSSTTQKRNRRPTRTRRGAAAVEMAFVAPVLFLLVLGAIEFGRAMMVANVLTSAAREGARAGVMPNADNNDATAAVNAELTAANIPPEGTTITIQVNGSTQNVSTAKVGDRVNVTVTVPFSSVTWLPSSFFLGSSTQLRGQAVMRRE